MGVATTQACLGGTTLQLHINMIMIMYMFIIFVLKMLLYTAIITFYVVKICYILFPNIFKMTLFIIIKKKQDFTRLDTVLLNCQLLCLFCFVVFSVHIYK